MSMWKPQRKAGRYRLEKGQRTVHVAVRMPSRLEQLIIKKVIELERMEIITSKSQLIRVLVETYLDDVVNIYLNHTKKSEVQDGCSTTDRP